MSRDNKTEKVAAPYSVLKCLIQQASDLILPQNYIDQSPIRYL